MELALILVVLHWIGIVLTYWQLELVPMVLALVLTVLAVELAMALKNVMDLPETSVRRSVQKLKKKKQLF